MYIFTFTILALFAIKDVFQIGFSTNRKLFILAILLLIFHDGFRWGIGTDWEAYLSYFKQNDWDNVDMDIGYIWLNKFISAFTDNYTVFLVIHAVIVYSLISRTIYKYSVYPLLSLFLFYALMITYLGMNRQYISFAIAIFSFQFLIENKKVIFIVLILFASLFHTSVLLFLFAIFFNREIKLKYILWLFFLALIISISGIINKLPLNIFYLFSENIGGKMSFYGTSYELETNIMFTILSLLKRSIWLIIASFWYDKLKNYDKNFSIIFNLYFVSTVIYILFNNTILQIIVARGMMFYNITEIFMIPYIISLINNLELKKLVMILVFIYGGITINKGMNYYKEDLGVDIFRPYNSVLINSEYNAMEDN